MARPRRTSNRPAAISQTHTPSLPDASIQPASGPLPQLDAPLAAAPAIKNPEPSSVSPPATPPRDKATAQSAPRRARPQAPKRAVGRTGAQPRIVRVQTVPAEHEETARKALASHRSGLLACFRSLEARDDLTLQLLVKPDGRTDHVRVRPQDARTARFVDCARSKARAVRFPPFAHAEFMIVEATIAMRRSRTASKP